MTKLTAAKHILRRPWPLWSPIITVVFYILLGVIAIRYAGQHADAILAALQVGFVIPALGLFIWSHRNESAVIANTSYTPSLITVVGTFLAFSLFTTLRMHQGETSDESAYLFQAKALASGTLSAEAPPIHKSMVPDYTRTFWFQGHLIHDGKWFGKYPPGWPLLLALGFATGLAPIVNPVIAACLLWLTYRIGYESFGKPEATLGTFILAMSPFFVYNSTGFLSHPSCAVAIAGATLCFLRAHSQHGVFWYTVAFVLIACGFMIRPYTALCAGAVLAVGLFVRLRPLKAIVILCYGGAILGAAAGVYLLYNNWTTGKAMLTGYELYNIQNPGRPAEMNFSPKSLLMNLTTVTRWSAQEMAVYSFPFVWLSAIAATLLECRLSRVVVFLASMAAVPMLANLAKPAPSHSFFGERYFYEAYVFLCVLGARGFRLLGLRLHVSAHAMHNFLMALAVLIVFPFLRFVSCAARWPQPYSAIERATASVSDAVVYMAPSPGFWPENLNANAAEWRHSSLFYLPDPGVERRPAVAASLEKGSWVVVCYEARQNSARICAAGGQ
jgi:Dolichyl-phosphate-mannose-protein mannosyltransferase